MPIILANRLTENEICSIKLQMLDIITYPNSVLDAVAKDVELPLNKETQTLIRKMFVTVEGKGVGLAAPQVGVSLQLCIIKLDPEMVKKGFKNLEFVMINPKITFYSEVKNKMVEGCLSFPNQYYQIVRPANIGVEFTTIKNFKEFINGSDPVLVTKNLVANEWLSRVIQHEVDHLNGKVFINLGGKKIQEDDLDEHNIVD